MITAKLYHSLISIQPESEPQDEALLSVHFGQADFYESPETEDQFITFRKELNEKLREACN